MPAMKLDKLMTAGSGAKKYGVLVSQNLGYTTVKMSLSIREILDIALVANERLIDEKDIFSQGDISQRELNVGHAKNLAIYTLGALAKFSAKKLWGDATPDRIKSVLENNLNSPYSTLQPIVANLRDCSKGGSDLDFEYIKNDGSRVDDVVELRLEPRHKFFIVDGQHRLKGFDMLLEWLEEVRLNNVYPVKGLFSPDDPDGQSISYDESRLWGEVFNSALGHSFLSVELHLGLDARQERQLFSDLNSKGRRVDASLAIEFDQADPINKMIEEVVKPILPFEPLRKDVKDGSGAMSLKDLKAVCTILIFGKTSKKNATEGEVFDKQSYVEVFWESIKTINGFGQPNAKSHSIIQQTVVLKALAKLIYDLKYGVPKNRDEEGLNKVIETIINQKEYFSHSKELWSALFMDRFERELKHAGVSRYIHVSKTYALDAGQFDSERKQVLFGSRHNDIYPRIGDLIRYDLGLQPRPSVTNAILKEKREEDSKEVLEKWH